MPNWSQRSQETELMDDLSIGGKELQQTLDELAFINSTLGGYAPSLHGIKQLLPAGARELTVLDVGCGCGDLPRRLVKWARRQNIQLHVLGIDLAADTVAHASARSQDFPELSFSQADLFALPSSNPFDIVHAGLVLHHMDNDLAPRFLQKMYQLSRLGVVVNDLHRHWFAYYAIRTLTKCLSRNRLIRHDAALSVLRGFRRQELLELCRLAQLPAPLLTWRWAFRWQLVLPKAAPIEDPSSDSHASIAVAQV